MATALSIPNDLSLKKYFFRSMVCHALLTVALLAGSYFERQGALCGGVGGQPGGTKVNLVSSDGIPMPKEEMVTDSKTVDPTKSLHKEEPKPKPPEPKTDSTKIPKFEKEKPLPPSRPSRTLERKNTDPNKTIKKKEESPNLKTG